MLMFVLMYSEGGIFSRDKYPGVIILQLGCMIHLYNIYTM